MSLLNIGDVTKHGGKVTRLIPARDLVGRWRQSERVGDAHYKILEEMIKRAAIDRAEVEAAFWEEVAKLAGYESISHAYMQNRSFCIDNGSFQIIEAEQAL